ncbi:MAG: regulatory protein GemA [Burkholderiaceae bacterium]|jgi:phage gp16-like protein|nr:regulatory protein GemA [Burkholderiaceae bacterium]
MTALAPMRRGGDRDIAVIHVLKSKLRLADDDYRVLLKALVAKTSSKDCTPAERARVRQHMQKLADRAGLTAPRTDQRTQYVQSTRPLERKVWALWNALGRAGKLDNPSAAALQAWVARQTGMDHVRFCNDCQLHGLIESLKLWQGRVNT